MSDTPDRYADLRERLARLNDPEARFELGEDARRAQLAALADQYLEELLESHDRYENLLYLPKVVPDA